jgi:Flp pilus assembly pilin Flp
VIVEKVLKESGGLSLLVCSRLQIKQEDCKMETLRNRVLKAFVRVSEAREGQGYTEYLILLALIAIAAYAAVKTLGTNVSTAMNSVAGSV